MKKFLLLLVTAIFAFGPTVTAQTRKMAFQVMALDSLNRVRANEQLVLKLHIDCSASTANTPTSYSQEFTITTDKMGIATVTLTLPENFDLSQGDYYLRTTIDGREVSNSQLTSVPFALYASQLDGIITQEELIGTWEGNSPYGSQKLIFKEDGTFSYYIGDEFYFGGKYYLNKAGNIALIRTEWGENAQESKKSDVYSLVKISSDEFSIEQFFTTMKRK